MRPMSRHARAEEALCSVRLDFLFDPAMLERNARRVSVNLTHLDQPAGDGVGVVAGDGSGGVAFQGRRGVGNGEGGVGAAWNRPRSLSPSPNTTSRQPCNSGRRRMRAATPRSLVAAAAWTVSQYQPGEYCVLEAVGADGIRVALIERRSQRTERPRPADDGEADHLLAKAVTKIPQAAQARVAVFLPVAQVPRHAGD